MKILKILLLSLFSIVGLKSFQPGVVALPSQASFPPSGFPNYYLNPNETVALISIKEAYFSAPGVSYNAPVTSMLISQADHYSSVVNTELKKGNAVVVYIVLQPKAGVYSAIVEIRPVNASKLTYKQPDIALRGSSPSVVQGLSFPVGGTVPNLINFSYRTSLQQTLYSCKISLNWDSDSGGYVGGFIFYPASYRTVQNMTAAVNAVVSNVQTQNLQTDFATNVANILKNVGFLNLLVVPTPLTCTDDWNCYICPALQSQPPTPSTTGSMMPTQQLQAQQQLVNQIAKAFGSSASCTLKSQTTTSSY